MTKHSISFFYTIFVVITTFSSIFSQENEIDNLIKQIPKLANDSNKVNLYNEISYQSYRVGDFESEMIYGKKALELAQQIKWKKGIADSYRNIGGAYEDISNYQEALKNYLLALEIYKLLLDKDGESRIYNNIGEVNRYLGNYPEALKYYYSSLKIKEVLNDKIGLSTVHNNLGIVYERISNYEEALKNHKASLALEIELGDQLMISSSYNNIGLVYENMNDYETALEYHYKSLEIRQKQNNKYGIANSYNNLGIIYLIKKDYQKSLEFCNAALEIDVELGNKTGVISSYNNLGRIFVETGKTKEGRNYLEQALVLAKEINHKDLMKISHLGLFKADSTIGDFKNSLINYMSYISIRDSLNNEEKTKLNIQQELQYEFDKKEALAKVEQDKKDALVAERNKKQDFQRNVLIAGIVALLILVTLIFISYQNKRKSNRIIIKQKEEVEMQRQIAEEQKKLLEEKNMEIVDSITYAKSLQNAILPPISLFKSVLKDVFILYQPKDIIAGDFYWLELYVDKATKDEHILFAAADCTGHGVPGAMVSVVCSNALHRAHTEFGLTSPNLILDKVRELVIQTFEKSENKVQDGMDISLVNYNLTQNTLEWSGANNPLWIIRNNELIELKPNKQPIGNYTKAEPFDNHIFKLEKDDLIYLFSDGFPDQFGGEKGKKFMIKNLKNLLLNTSHLPMNEQENSLSDEFSKWKGENEQVDDVCIIGVRL